MTILKYPFILLTLILCRQATAQVEISNETFAPRVEVSVPAHKENLKLTLLIDSIRIGKKVHKLSFRKNLDISYESDYLQVLDDIYIKIFISRNQEYGKKFYAWKWDYLKKTGNKFNKLGIGYYNSMDYNLPIPENGNYGQGIGTEGTADYLMFYYRYKLE